MIDDNNKVKWVKFLDEVVARQKDTARITQVMDNLHTHWPGRLHEAFPPAQAKALWNRFKFAYTPKHDSC